MIRVIYPVGIPDPDLNFLPIPDPRSRGQIKRHRIRIRISNTVTNRLEYQRGTDWNGTILINLDDAIWHDLYHKPITEYEIFRDKSDLLRERLLSRLCLDLLRLFSLLLLLWLADLLLLLPFSELADLLLLLSLLTLADRLRSPIFRPQSQRLLSIFEFLKQLSMQMLGF